MLSGEDDDDCSSCEDTCTHSFGVQFLDLVQLHGESVAPVEYANHALEDVQAIPYVQETMCVLAFAEPWKHPRCAYLFAPSRRVALADLVNDLLLGLFDFIIPHGVFLPPVPLYNEFSAGAQNVDDDCSFLHICLCLSVCLSLPLCLCVCFCPCFCLCVSVCLSVCLVACL